LLVGLSYVLLFGGLSLLRREGLSVQFAVEAVIFTLVVAGLSALTGAAVSPILFLLLLYLLTMRVRLLVDLGNLLARRGNFAPAASVYRLAARLWPDDAARLLVQINQGVLDLQTGRLDEAVAAFKAVLAEAKGGYLGVKHECASHYNLAVAYQRQGQDAQAVLEFNAVLETWPASEYARYAAIALERRQKGMTSNE
jgi:tetratricopeptide (TPR) repeat protein